MAATTQQIIGIYHDLYDAGDLDQFMSLYSHESVLISGDRICRGQSEIRKYFEWLISDVLPPSADFEFIHEVIEGELAYFVWRSRTEKTTVRLGTDTLVIRDGIITYQTLLMDFDNDR